MWIRTQNKRTLSNASSFWIEPGKDKTRLMCSIGNEDAEAIGEFVTEKAALEELDRLGNRLNAVQISEDTHG